MGTLYVAPEHDSQRGMGAVIDFETGSKRQGWPGEAASYTNQRFPHGGIGCTPLW